MSESDRRLRIYFSQPREGVETTLLAQSCGIGKRWTVPSVGRLLAEGPSFWSATDDVTTADLVADASRYQASPATIELARLAERAGKPCVFFDTSDFPLLEPPPYGVIYRPALYADRLRPSDRAAAPPSDDLLRDLGGMVQPLQKTSEPSVGFCGYITPRWKQMLRALRGDREKAIGHVVRRRALAVLSRARGVRTHFIVRRHFNGGALLTNDPAALEQSRQEFVANVLESDYTLCARGAGNFSIRFYETLSAGRIPILVDTRCVLPFADRIDWPRHCVIVPEAQIGRAGEVLRDFHAGLSPDAFEALQHANRALWQRWLEPLSFLQTALSDVLKR